MRGAMSRLRVYLFRLSPSRIVLPTLVEFGAVPQLFNRPAARSSYSCRAALGYDKKKARQWLDIMWVELANHIHSFAGYVQMQGIRKAGGC